MKKVCIAGLGNMGSAIFDLLKSNDLFDVVGFDKDEDVNEFLEDSDVIILAVKPQNFEDLSKLIEVDLSDKIVISIMAGISIVRLKIGLKSSKIVRVMPNLPLKFGAAVSGWFPTDSIDYDEKDLIKNILSTFGEEIELDKEEKIDAITALSGSGPAYYYFLNKSLVEKALEFGFTDTQARKIVKGTFLGSCKLLQASTETSEKLIERISSKGGTTEAAFNFLKENDVDSLIKNAVNSAYKRSKELNEQ